ncbi:MAG: phage tail tube protein [Promethearchaeota archaeon]|jgi:hypothetical protein
MPVPACFRDTDICKSDAAATADLSSAKTNLGDIIGEPEGLFAHMGWVGYANLVVPPLTPQLGQILRVTSADINLIQDITTPDVIDGRIDRTVYQLGPKIIEGTLSLPVIADVDPGTITGGCVKKEDLTTGTASTLLDTLWCWTTARSSHGRLQWTGSLDIRYSNHAAFTFTKAVVNTLSMSVAQQDVVSFDVDVIGAVRNRTTSPFSEPIISDFLSPARVLTWNDVTISGVGGCGSGSFEQAALFESAQLREFSFEINNNAERYYSLNGRLFPIDINVSKREITGSMTLMGLQERLRLRAEAQQEEFTRKDEIRMMFFVGDEATSGVGLDAVTVSRDWFQLTDTPVTQNGAIPFFWKKFTGVIFRIEEMALSNDVYETTVNWLALGNDQEGYLAVVPGSSCDFPAWT